MNWVKVWLERDWVSWVEHQTREGDTARDSLRRLTEPVHRAGEGRRQQREDPHVDLLNRAIADIAQRGEYEQLLMNAVRLCAIFGTREAGQLLDGSGKTTMAHRKARAEKLIQDWIVEHTGLDDIPASDRGGA